MRNELCTAGVNSLEHPGAGLAPWNDEQYTLEGREGPMTVDGLPLVFYHYHSLKLFAGVTMLRRLGFLSGEYELTSGALPLVWRQNYEMPREVRTLVGDPYLDELGSAFLDLRRVQPGLEAGFIRLDGRALALREARSLARRRLPRLSAAAGRVKRRLLDEVSV